MHGANGSTFAEALIAVAQERRQEEADDAALAGLDFSTDGHAGYNILPAAADKDAHESPAVALACATREALRIGDVVEEMLERTFEVFRDDDTDGRKYVDAMDDEVDPLHEGIKIYLAKLMRAELDQDESERTIEILSFATNLEHVGDIIDRNLMELAANKKRSKAMFSEQGLREQDEFHGAVHANIKRAMNVFLAGDLARQLLAQIGFSLRRRAGRAVTQMLGRM